MTAMTPIMTLPPLPLQPNVANPENLANVANPENLANVANPENLTNVARGLGKCEQSLAENHEEAPDEGLGGAIEWISLN